MLTTIPGQLHTILETLHNGFSMIHHDLEVLARTHAEQSILVYPQPKLTADGKTDLITIQQAADRYRNSCKTVAGWSIEKLVSSIGIGTVTYFDPDILDWQIRNNYTDKRKNR